MADSFGMGHVHVCSSCPNSGSCVLETVFSNFGALRFKLGIVSLVKNEATEKFDLSQSIFNEKPTSKI
jgi:hypothetical protein